MDPKLQALMQAAATGTLQQALQAQKPTPQLAAAARQVFIEARNAKNGGLAMTAAYLAATLYHAMGDETSRMANLFDFLQVEFMVANTGPEYQTVRERALGLVSIADSVKSRPFGFYAMVMAADCAYFSAEATNNDSAAIIATLRDLKAVCERADGFQKDANFAKFVDLLANVANLAMPRLFLEQDQAQVDQLLTDLAKYADALIPADFEYFNNPQQTAKINAVLAQLTDKYAE